MTPSVFIGSNVVAVFLAAAAHMALGIIWYAPNAFGSEWMRQLKLNPKKMDSMSVLSWVLPFISSLVMAMVLLEVIVAFEAHQALDGAIVGSFIGVGFVLTMGAVQDMFANRSLTLFLISYGYHFVGLLIMGAILGAWL